MGRLSRCEEGRLCLAQTRLHVSRHGQGLWQEEDCLARREVLQGGREELVRAFKAHRAVSGGVARSHRRACSSAAGDCMLAQCVESSLILHAQPSKKLQPDWFKPFAEPAQGSQEDPAKAKNGGFSFGNLLLLR
eukprot:760247-Hanusia_phi.AAC.4